MIEFREYGVDTLYGELTVLATDKTDAEMRIKDLLQKLNLRTVVKNIYRNENFNPEVE